MTTDACGWMIVGLIIIIIGLFFHLHGFDGRFLFGWGCAEVYLSIQYRNHEFVKVE